MVKTAIFRGRQKLARRLQFFWHELKRLQCRSEFSVSCVVRGHQRMAIRLGVDPGGNTGEDNGVLRSNPWAPFFFARHWPEGCIRAFKRMPATTPWQVEVCDGGS
jgi:hypothetical protein